MNISPFAFAGWLVHGEFKLMKLSPHYVCGDAQCHMLNVVVLARINVAICVEFGGWPMSIWHTRTQTTRLSERLYSTWRTDTNCRQYAIAEFGRVDNYSPALDA